MSKEVSVALITPHLPPFSTQTPVAGSGTVQYSEQDVHADDDVEPLLGHLGAQPSSDGTPRPRSRVATFLWPTHGQQPFQTVNNLLVSTPEIGSRHLLFTHSPPRSRRIPKGLVSLLCTLMAIVLLVVCVGWNWHTPRYCTAKDAPGCH